MRTQWNEGGETKKVTSPVSLIVSAFATLADVRGTLTPQLNNALDDTTLVLIDLGKGRHRMGGSVLAQMLGQGGGEVPDLDDAQDLINLVNAVNALRAQGKILAYHDRSDGGLLAAAAEMAFAGHVGVALNVDLLRDRRRRHQRQPRRGGRRQKLGRSGRRAARGTHAQGAVQRRAGRAAAGEDRRPQRGDADPARARPEQTQPLRRQDPPGQLRHGRGQRPAAGLARHQGRVLAPACSTCTRSGTA